MTLCYLRRSLAFFRELLEHSGLAEVRLTREVYSFYEQVFRTLDQFQALLNDHFDDSQRRSMMDALGQAGSNYRWDYYSRGISGELNHVTTADLARFLDLAQRYVEHSLRANQRDDHLFHSYNVLHLGNDTAAIGRLDEMLEGQVAILSSGMLGGRESLALLESLRKSRLYRPDPPFLVGYGLDSSSSSGAGILIAATCFVCLLPIWIVVIGALRAYITSAWTLTYLRLTGKSMSPTTSPPEVLPDPLTGELP